MQTQGYGSRREHGDGSLFTRTNAKGETWLCKWRADGRQYMRSLGVKRSKTAPEGLTRAQAEAAFKRLRDEVQAAPEDSARPSRRTVVELGEDLVALKVRIGRKKSTTDALDTWVRIHIKPFFGVTDVNAVRKEDVENFAQAVTAKGLSAKSVANGLGVLHSVFELAIDRGWRKGANPVKGIAKPAAVDADPDIHFLVPEEVEALVRAVPDDILGRIERVMYLTAAMTGLRQGELLALRWSDIDWTAQRVRVRRNYVRGEFGTPKSKRSSRSVPLATRLAGELDRLHTSSGEPGDDELVFAHPLTSKPIDRSKLLKRFKAALLAGRIGRFEVVVDKRGKQRERPVFRFHDLRHTFGTRMAAQGVPMRTLQEWMGHRDFKTTLIYSDYSPSAHEAEWIEGAFSAPTLAAVA